MPDEQKPRDEMIDTLILTLDRRTMTLGFNGDVWERVLKHEPRSFDILLNILGQAVRQADVQYRIVCGVEAQNQIKKAQEEAALRNQLMNRGAQH